MEAPLSLRKIEEKRGEEFNRETLIPWRTGSEGFRDCYTVKGNLYY